MGLSATPGGDPPGPVDAAAGTRFTQKRAWRLGLCPPPCTRVCPLSPGAGASAAPQVAPPREAGTRPAGPLGPCPGPRGQPGRPLTAPWDGESLTLGPTTRGRTAGHRGRTSSNLPGAPAKATHPRGQGASREPAWVGYIPGSRRCRRWQRSDPAGLQPVPKGGQPTTLCPPPTTCPDLGLGAQVGAGKGGMLWTEAVPTCHRQSPLWKPTLWVGEDRRHFCPN